MDCLGWDDPPLWSNEQHEIGEGSMASNANGGILGGKVDLYEGVLFDPNMELRRTRVYDTSSDFEGVSKMVQQLAPVLDSINAVRLAPDTVLASSGTGSTWTEALTAELGSSNVVSSSYGLNPLNDIMADFGVVDRLRVVSSSVGAGRGGVSGTAGSLESLDCLLSATNSSTDTSMEDDGISVIFSDCKNLWNFNCGGEAQEEECQNFK
uniref:Uncharacterized protein n=1 Tax=Nelumbo nucifera TaxID=4432 RepID=A0A823A0R8_NELNU|nr:TPA_asm: hypothetical protein HUJ06_018846 [Nelumbo nucifera]